MIAERAKEQTRRGLLLGRYLAVVVFREMPLNVTKDESGHTTTEGRSGTRVNAFTALLAHSDVTCRRSDHEDSFLGMQMER